MFHTHSLRSTLSSMWFVFIAASGQATAQEYRYALFNLPSLTQEDQFDGAQAINEAGEVVGAATVDGGRFHAALWRDGQVFDLGTFGGDSEARAINSRGDVVGWSDVLPGVERSFLWRDGVMIDLGTLGGERSEARGMNDFEQVVGNADVDPSSRTNIAFLWEDGQMIALRAPRKGRFGAAALDVNDWSHIVGAALGSETQATGTLWIDQEPIDLGSLAGSGSTALAINDLGVIVGQSEAANEKGHAVVRVDRQIFDIHNPSLASSSGAHDINNHGQIVGWVAQNVLNFRAFIRNPGEPMKLLIDFTPPKPPKNWRLQFANGINDAGQIAAFGIEEGRPFFLYAFLLSPVYPTIEMESPQPGRAGEANRLRVTNCTPGARVTFLYSRHGGGQRIPGCDLQQNAIQLDRPTVIGSAIADGNGVATITRHVPIIARGQTVLFQAVVQSECAISQLVVHEFE